MSTEFDFLGSKVTQSTALPASYYTSEAAFQREQAAIFHKDWHPVCRADQVSGPGDYLVVELCGSEIIVMRGEDGAVHALANVCLHRALTLLTGKGHCDKLIVCPYHLWSYSLDGRAHGTPCMDQAEDFDKQSLQLKQYPVFEWLGFVMVSLEQNATAPLAEIEELTGQLAPFAIETFREVGTLSFESPWNWKVMVDNFMESYHHMGAHAETLNGVFPTPGTYRAAGNTRYTLLENPSVDESLAASFWVAMVFPTLMFVLTRSDTKPTLAWYQMDINEHDRFVLNIHVCLPPENAANPADVEETLATLNVIHQEDIPMCERVWKGLHQRDYKPGRLSHLEGCLWDFYKYLETRLG